MISTLRLARSLRLLAAFILLAHFMVRPALAQSILRDAETEAVFAEMTEPLIRAAGLVPRNVNIVLIGDNSINAFVATGQTVYVHTGLVAAADNANEVQGVLAHELGHIAGGHSVRFSEGMKTATGISLLSLLLGAAAIAAGAGDAGAGIIAAGQQAAFSKFLAFSREQESRTDQAGAVFLSKAGISGRGSIAFFKRLQNIEYRYAIPQDDSYGRTHPLSSERIAVLQEIYERDRAWNKPTDPAIEAKFQRVKAKLKGFVQPPADTLRDYPETDKSVPATYARAYAWHRAAYPDKALATADELLKMAPGDPYFLELKGQILLESGKPKEAVPILRDAVAKTNAQPLIASLFGHALIASEDPAMFDEAQRVLKASVGKDNENPFAWYQLGVVYDRLGDAPRAAMATAERYQLEGRPRLALVNAELALRGLPSGSADWIRAQDIAMVARVEAEKEKKRR